MAYIWRQIRKHPDVMPVFFITILGATFATTALVRACVRYTDVSFRRKSNPHPWLNVKHDQHTKFIRTSDYKSLKPRPTFED